MASRRGMMASLAALTAAVPTLARGATDAPLRDVPLKDREPFYGPHQGGILTSAQGHSYFAALDVTATQTSAIVTMLCAWTEAAAKMTNGEPAANDSGEAAGLSPARLTITFGFGPDLFVKDGKDRFGLASKRPEALLPLKRFSGDQLQPARSGGDLSIQACADDPQVAFHAVRQLLTLAYGTAQLRWAQTGFQPDTKPGDTGRNLMGFKDGTHDPVAPSPTGKPLPDVRPGLPADTVVWVGDEGPDWLRGGSYVVARRIRISLEHWDRTPVDFQEQVVGRQKISGAPLGGTDEFSPPDFAALDADGNPVIPEDAHLRLAAPRFNAGAEILRRGYAYNDGLTLTAERWPPWRQGLMFDAGLFFVGYQKDPRTGFIPVFETMSKLDALNQFTTHVGSGLFACPPGVRPGEFIGQRLFA